MNIVEMIEELTQPAGTEVLKIHDEVQHPRRKNLLGQGNC